MRFFLSTITLILFLGFSQSVFSQRKITDSLKLEFEKARDTTKIKLLNELTWETYLLGDLDEATAHAEKAIALSKKLPPSNTRTKLEADAFNNLGNIFGDKSLYDKSLEYYNRSLELRTKIKDKKGMAASYNNIGGIYRYLGNGDTALLFHFKSLKLKEEIADKKGMASSYNNIGNIYNDKKNPDKALEYYFQSLKLKQEIGNKLGIADSYVSIGIIYRQKKQYDKCMDYYQKGTQMYEELGNRQRMSISYNNMGNLLEDMKEYDRALNFHSKSLKIREALGDRMGMAASYSNIGNIYTTQRKLVHAKQAQEKALQLATSIHAIPDMMATYQALAYCENELGNYKKAYRYQKAYSRLKDSVFTEQSAIKTAEIEQKYQSEKKDKEIIKKNAEIKLRDAAIKLKDADSRKQSLQIKFILAGAFLLLVVLFFIFYSFRQKQKANILLANKNHDIQLQKELIEEQHWLLSEKNKEITQSIQYSKRIQTAILPPEQFISKVLPESFILFKPKDIVSGDFYWIEKFGNQVIVAAVDCTGHGVPGAFMTFVAHSLLNEAVNEHGITVPAVILSEMRKGLFKLLHVGAEGDYIKDGMDIAICAIDFETKKLEFAGAYNPAWIMRGKECIELKADKTPIGALTQESNLTLFTNHEITLEKGDCVYLFSDGYHDQFGMADSMMINNSKIKTTSGKKLKRKGFKDVLLTLNHLPCEEQKNKLEAFFYEWKSELEQVDDVLVIGIKI